MIRSLRFSSAIFLALAASAGLSLAGDVVKLKSGEKLEGVILSETPTEIKIEIQETKSIKSTRTLKRSEIAELIKATPDQFEAAELAKLVPTEDLLSDNAYQTVISEKLEPFLKKYPASPHKADVEAILNTYKEEMAKAKTGAKKLEGVWITPAELDWNAYNFEARLRRVEFDKLLKAGKPEAAYRILAELEAAKPASVETATAIERFKAAIPEFERTLDRLIVEQPIKLKNRVDSAKTLSPDEKKRVDEALKQETEDLKLRVDEDRKNKLGIVAYSEYDLKSLADTKIALQKEAARINKIDLETLKAAATTFQSGLKNYYEKSFLAAQKNFEDAAKVFQKDDFVKERAELSKKAALETAKANAEASAGKPLTTTTDPAAKTPEAPSPAAKTSEPAKTEGGAPVKKTPVPMTPAADDTAEEVEPEPESSNLPMILVAGAAVLIIALLIVKALAKKKAAAADE